MLRPLKQSLMPLMLAAAVPASASYSSVVLADSPTVYWRLNETSGSTAADSSGNGNTGTYSNCTLGDSAPPTGAGHSIGSVPTNSSYVSDLSLTFNYSSASVEIWVYVTAYPSSGTKARLAGCCAGNGGGVDDKELGIDSSGLPYWYIYDGASLLINGTSAIPLNTWTYIAGTVSGSASTLYVNGSSVASTSATGSYTGYASGNILVAGHNVNDFGAYLTGQLAEFAIYPSSLSSTRIAAHYAAA